MPAATNWPPCNLRQIVVAVAFVKDLDIWCAAKLLIDRHGESAAVEAMKRADALAAQGDAAGKVAWLRILEAIEELQSTVPSGPIH